jgi:HK97 gp10 family phage protein
MSEYCEGADELIRDIRKLEKKLQNAVLKEILREEAAPLAQYLQANWARDTGKTAKGFKVKHNRSNNKEVSVKVESRKGIANLTEFGTVNQTAQGDMRHGVFKLKGEMTKGLAARVEKIHKESGL